MLTWLYFVTICGKKADFPGDSDSKEFACNAGDLGLISRWGRSPGEGHGNPLQYSCLENSHGQRSLAGYSPWYHKELDVTERLNNKNSDVTDCMGKGMVLKTLIRLFS